MKNNKRIIFIILLSLFSLILLFRVISLNKNSENLDHIKEKNTAELIEFVGPKEISFGKDGIKKGYYDICVKEDVDTNAFRLKKGHCLLNKYYSDNNVIETSDNIDFTMIPSKFNTLDFSKGYTCLENTVGTFQVGVEIEKGVYEVKLESDYNDHQMLIQILNSENEIINEMQIKNEESVEIKLKEGDFLNFMNMDVDYDFKLFIKIL